MPTLIRFFVTIAVLGGLVFGGMVALSVFVEPSEKEVTVRIPTRTLMGG